MQAHIPWENGAVYWDFGGGRLIYTPPVPIVGTWQHFALVSSQAGNFMKIYRNGILEAQQEGAGARSAGEFDLLLGHSSRFFDGELDEFRLWSVARDEADIQQNYNLRLTGTEPSLVAYYRMDEGAGSTLRDLGRNGFNGLFEAGTHWTASTAPIGVPIPGILPASDVGRGAATLNGRVKQDRLPTTVHFEVYPVTGRLSESSSRLI